MNNKRKQRWPQALPQYWAARLRHRPSDGFFDCEMQLFKERHRITIRFRTEQQARIEAARIWLLIRREGWEAYDFYDPPLGKYMDAYSDLLIKGGTSPKTVNQYRIALFFLLRNEWGFDGTYKYGRAKSKDKKAERKLFYEELRISDLTTERCRKWYQDYPTQAKLAKYLFQPRIVAQLRWRIKRPLPFRRIGEEGNSAEWYPRPW